ncbi:hypothetical protein A0130_06110 [Leifsonia xyli]|uniref:hypothetical protein n=1 Tax=Leifsonia xyli TaxID=1575 RepID=UPI0007CDB66F|nr:hypothetical protein A0130_06110 [Leifsonia xyli]
MGNDSGPRDWLAGGRYWDESPSPRRGAPPPSLPPIAYRPIIPPRRRGSWTWSILALLVGAGAVLGLYGASQLPGRISPLFGLFGGIAAVVFGIAAWRTRPHAGAAWSVLIPMAVIGAGLLTAGTTAVSFHTLTTSPASATVRLPGSQQVAAPPVVPATPAAAQPQPAPLPAPAPAPEAAPARPVADRMSMGQALGTLQFGLKFTRGPDGLQSPALAVTSGGLVVDPFSVTPERVLAILPAGTTLTYTVSPDRRNYAVVLVSDADPSLVARFDTVNGVIEFG